MPRSASRRSGTWATSRVACCARRSTRCARWTRGSRRASCARTSTIDDEFRSIVRQLITFMMEDPRTISSALEILWIAKAIERIGDHAKNMAEQVIYIVKGTDVRHTTVEDLEREALG